MGRRSTAFAALLGLTGLMLALLVPTGAIAKSAPTRILSLKVQLVQDPYIGGYYLSGRVSSSSLACRRASRSVTVRNLTQRTRLGRTSTLFGSYSLARKGESAVLKGDRMEIRVRRRKTRTADGRTILCAGALKVIRVRRVAVSDG